MDIMAKRNIYQIITIGIISFLLFGCSQKSNILFSDKLSTPKSITHWKISGKISGFDKKNNWRGSLNWTQDHNNYQIRLIPSLTSRTILLRQTKNQASLETGQEKTTGKLLDKILFEKVGWYIPFHSMPYWLRGLPDPNSEHKITMKNDNTIIILQDGWTIEYKKFVVNNNYLLPKKIFINNKKYHLRLIINEWLLS